MYIVTRPVWKVSFITFVFQYAYAPLTFDLDWSSFRVTPAVQASSLSQCLFRQNNWSCTEISPFTDCNNSLLLQIFDSSIRYKAVSYRFKWLKNDVPGRNFQPPPWILPKIFYTVLTYTFVIPFSKQKHTTGSLTHTHMTSNDRTNKKQLGTSHLLLMVISQAQTRLLCAKFRPIRVIKKDIILLTLDLPAARCGDARRPLCSNRRTVSRVRVGFANGTKWTPSQNWGNQLSELHVPHRQCLAGISNAFSASFTSIWPSFPRFYCSPNEACLLCATPAGTYRVQSPEFPKLVC